MFMFMIINAIIVTIGGCMKHRITKILLSIAIFLSYFGFSYLIEFLINIFNIDMSTWKYIYRIIFVYVIELIPFIFMILIYKKTLSDDFKSFKLNWKDYLDKYIRWWLLAITLMVLFNTIITIITSSEMSNNEVIIRKITEVLPIYSFISSCICAPIIEELAYRKIFKDIFNVKWLSILISGLVFGAAHVISTYSALSDLLYIIPYGVFGSIFMYIYQDSDNIWTTISIHFIHNFILLIMYFSINIFG